MMPHVVGACNGLGRVDEFQNITPPGANLANAGVTQVIADEVNSGTIIVGLDTKGIWKSTDCGATWRKVNTGRNGNLLDGGSPWLIRVDPVNPQVMYSGALYGSDLSLFKSTNGGVDWDSLWPKGSLVEQNVEYNFLQWMAMDPTDHRHLVVSFHANCKDPTQTDPNRKYTTSCLGESLDSGATWRLLKGPTPSWLEGAGPIIFNRTNWVLATPQNGVYCTVDAGATWKKVGQGTNGIKYLAKDGYFYLGSDYGMARTKDGCAWEQLTGTPTTFAIGGDGTRMFTSARWANQTQQPYWSASESEPTKWTPMPSPRMTNGGVYFAYDPDHHLLYSANTSGGLWRVKTQ